MFKRFKPPNCGKNNRENSQRVEQLSNPMTGKASREWKAMYMYIFVE